ncbi:DUF3052 family protein [Corynebacterium ulceribovis]|uniref:DUF3052 domain-containing protein n=1 Tax=Corynebacterium ulceribovis TaxID=487732 RepID=UPI000370D172
MGDAAGAQGSVALDYVDTLGIREGQVVQEIGWDEDCDTAISEAVEDFLDTDLLPEDTDEVVDVVLAWWREEDGDLVDGLVDMIRPLSDNGRIWLLTPGPKESGALDHAVIQESAVLAGLVVTTTNLLGQWSGTCLVQRPTKR